MRGRGRVTHYARTYATADLAARGAYADSTQTPGMPTADVEGEGVSMWSYRLMPAREMEHGHLMVARLPRHRAP